MNILRITGIIIFIIAAVVSFITGDIKEGFQFVAMTLFVIVILALDHENKELKRKLNNNE